MMRLVLSLFLVFGLCLTGCDTIREIIENPPEIPEPEPEPEPEPDPDPPVVTGLMLNDFLSGWRRGELFAFSHNMPDSEYQGILDSKKSKGHNTITPYCYNVGDGDGRLPVNVHEHMDLARRRTDQAMAAGFQVFPVGYADDSHSITMLRRVSDAELIAMITEVWAEFEDDWAGICVFLEPDEVGRREDVSRAIEAVAAHIDPKPCAVHTMRLTAKKRSVLWPAFLEGVDQCWGQICSPGSPVSPAEAVLIAKWAQDQLPEGVTFVGYEYAFDGEAIGNALLEAGFGVGNGFDQVPEPDPEPDPDPPSPKLVWKYGGVDGSKAKVTADLFDTRLTHDRVYYSMFVDWKNTGEAGTCSYGCSFIQQPNGEWWGGKFEWARKGKNQFREFKNLRNSLEQPQEYKGHRIPRSGERWGYLNLKLDGTERTSMTTWTWP